MKINKILLFGITFLLFAMGCKKDEIVSADQYACTMSFADSSATHPKAATYQTILDRNITNGFVGAVLLVKDKDGVWIGAGGKADIASDVDMKPCNTFFIGSLSKVYTAAVVYKHIENGTLAFDDPINKYLSGEITDKIANANEAQIKHLLAHRSGIVDFETSQYGLDLFNNIDNHFTKEDILSFCYGRAAEFPVDATFKYSNTNYLLLSMILEAATGKDFETLYYEELFTPLGLHATYFSATDPKPDGLVKAYYDRFKNGTMVESEHFYLDGIRGTGGTGGIASDAYNVAVFLEQLMKGNIISTASINEMTNWFDLPSEAQGFTFGMFERGYGIAKFENDYAYGVGHPGGLFGFQSMGIYFPEEDMTYVLLTNTEISTSLQPYGQIYKEVIKEMFE